MSLEEQLLISCVLVIRYGLKTRGQRAAYIATMAYEGGYLQYDRNLVISTQGSK